MNAAPAAKKEPAMIGNLAVAPAGTAPVDFAKTEASVKAAQGNAVSTVSASPLTANAVPAVREVFDITGFSDILTLA